MGGVTVNRALPKPTPKLALTDIVLTSRGGSNNKLTVWKEYDYIKFKWNDSATLISLYKDDLDALIEALTELKGQVTT